MIAYVKNHGIHSYLPHDKVLRLRDRYLMGEPKFFTMLIIIPFLDSNTVAS